MRNNKKGLSEIITWVIGIALVMVAVGIVWAVVSGLLTSSLDKASSCANIFEKVKLNPEFTCHLSGTYVATGNVTLNSYALVSVDVRDIELDKIAITVSGERGTSKTFQMENRDGEGYSEDLATSYFMPYRGLPGLDVGLNSSCLPTNFPNANEGETYVLAAGGIEPIKTIKLSVSVNGNDCGVVDTLNVESCASDLYYTNLDAACLTVNKGR